MSTTPDLPADSQMGTDGRPHHEKGFSFLTVLEKCPAARRSKSSAANLQQAGERGVMLHGLLELLVEDWASFAAKGKPLNLAECLELRLSPTDKERHAPFSKLKVPDMTSLTRVVDELNPLLSVEPGMLFGTEERIDLRDEEGEVISFGYYDLFLKLGKTVLVVDHKFVRKEVDAAEKNRQGHAMVVSVFQTYTDVEDVVVLFSMPECESSMYRFNRTQHLDRLTMELSNIIFQSEQPFKVLQPGDHCVYCQFRGTCKAAIGGLEKMVTGINPLAVPASFAPQLVKTAEDMAILRYWADTVQPVIDAIKDESTKWAQAQQGIHAVVNGQHVEYKVQSRSMPRQLAAPIEIWKEVQTWMPAEALLSACKTSVTALEEVVVQLISARLIDEGKKPNAKKIAADFSARLLEKGLLSQEEGRTYFLKRVKASAKSEAKQAQLADENPPIDSDDKS